MKVLMLGGAGFLGSYLCEGLVNSGYEVTVFDRENISYGNLESVINKINIIKSNFANDCDFDIITKNTDIVFHLISSTIPSTSNRDMAYDLQSNVISTVRFLDSCVKNNVRKVMFFSSGGTIYGIPAVTPIKEEHPTNPICSYGIHKLMIEKYLDLYRHLYGLDYTVMRISNPYGPRQSPFSGQGVISAFVYKAIHDMPIDLWGDGTVTRDFIYVTDVIKAALVLLKYNGDCKVFNVGSGRGVSINDIICKIEGITGKRFIINRFEARNVDVKLNILDIEKIKKETEWKPEISLETGIKALADYYLGQALHTT
jgi:UDP-glucose 4-epimerase